MTARARGAWSFGRRLAAEALGRRPEPEATAALIRLLRDSNTKVRTAAHRSLLGRGDPGEEALRQAVGRCESKRGLEPLRHAVRGFELRRRAAAEEPVSEGLVRTSLVAACGLDILETALRERARSEDVEELIALLGQRTKGVRWTCVRMLVGLGDASVGPLERFLGTNPPEPARTAAREALTELTREEE